jgi:hypothetical protein
MIADYLTKGLPYDTFVYLRHKVQGWWQLVLKLLLSLKIQSIGGRVNIHVLAMDIPRLVGIPVCRRKSTRSCGVRLCSALTRRTKILFLLPMTIPILMMLLLWILSISQSSKSLHVPHFTFIYILYYLSSQILSALVRLHVEKLRKMVVVSSESFLEVFHYSRFSF